MLLICYLQQNTFLTYTDGTPITYEVWNNFLIKNQKLQIALLEGNIKTLSHRNFYKRYLEKIKIAQSRLQPELQNDNCVLMITAALTEADWITVPCHEKNSHLILCQKATNHTVEKIHMIHNNNLKTI